MTSESLPYVGTELELFAAAVRWKAYFSRSIRGWIRGDVLEVGAGIGANTLLLHNQAVRSWHALEPDAALAVDLERALAPLPDCRVTIGTTATAALDRYDSVLYIDVLEHIADDNAELARASALLKPSGSLIVLAPAHQFLYSEFDKAIGHYRRYDATSLRAAGPPGCRLDALYYLDSVGILASLANRTFLKRSQPTPAQIAVWDRYFVGASKLLDRLTLRRIGKSVIGVWTREP